MNDMKEMLNVCAPVAIVADVFCMRTTIFVPVAHVTCTMVRQTVSAKSAPATSKLTMPPVPALVFIIVKSRKLEAAIVCAVN